MSSRERYIHHFTHIYITSDDLLSGFFVFPTSPCGVFVLDSASAASSHTHTSHTHSATVLVPVLAGRRTCVGLLVPLLVAVVAGVRGCVRTNRRWSSRTRLVALLVSLLLRVFAGRRVCVRAGHRGSADVVLL